MLDFMKRKSILYLDIRGDVVRAAQGCPADSNLSIDFAGFGTITLPGFLEPAAEEAELEANASKLKAFLRENNITAKKVVASFGQKGILTRTIKVPKMEPGDLASMMKLGITDHLPIDLEEYAFDYKVLTEVEETDGAYLEVMVVAVKHFEIGRCMTLLEKVGLKPIVLDVLPNVLYRLFGFSNFEDTMVIDGGREGTRLAIFQGRSLFMYNDLPFALNDEEEAQDFATLIMELQGYVDYFSSRNFGKNIDRIFVLGELAFSASLQETLQTRFELPLNFGLKNTEFTLNKNESLLPLLPVYTGVLGLMLRETEWTVNLNIITQVRKKFSGTSLGT
ncbi:pilus assembly protein PilM [Bacillota bacterium LX-D]|nr:pilus assembly protein PilM [Bacillota bacterium LX-D]